MLMPAFTSLLLHQFCWLDVPTGPVLLMLLDEGDQASISLQGSLVKPGLASGTSSAFLLKCGLHITHSPTTVWQANYPYCPGLELWQASLNEQARRQSFSLYSDIRPSQSSLLMGGP